MASMKNLSIATVGAVLVALGIGETAKAITIYTNPDNGHKYFLTEPNNWYDAQAEAKSIALARRVAAY